MEAHRRHIRVHALVSLLLLLACYNSRRSSLYRLSVANTTRSKVAGNNDDHGWTFSKTCMIQDQSYECGPTYNFGKSLYREYFLDTGPTNAGKRWSEWSAHPSTRIDENGDFVSRRKMKVVLMTRNEWPLLKWWVFYHGGMLGFDNLYIIDGSDDKRCIDFLLKVRDKYKVNSIFLKSDLNQVTKDINDIMTSLVAASDLLMKLDTDEFLAVVPEANVPLPKTATVSTQGAKHYSGCPDWRSLTNISTLQSLHESCQLTPFGVQEYLDSPVFPLDGSRLKIGFVAGSIPNLKACSGPDQGGDLAEFSLELGTPTRFKSFFDSRTFKNVDLGSHSGDLYPPFDNAHMRKESQWTKFTALGVIHFHSRCFELESKMNRQAIIRHGFIDEDDTDKVVLAKSGKGFGRDAPSKETNCSEPMQTCNMNSCHKAYGVMRELLCPKVVKNEYYTTSKDVVAPHNEEFIKYIRQLQQKYQITID